MKQHNIAGCRIGNLQNGSLLIEIPDATWQLRLQFMRNDILSLLRQEAPALLKLKFSVNPRLKELADKPKRKPRKHIKPASKMPNDVAQSFLSLAENADPALQKALRSLAKYSK